MAFKSLFQGSIIEICCDKEKVGKSSEVSITQKKKSMAGPCSFLGQYLIPQIYPHVIGRILMAKTNDKSHLFDVFNLC